MGYSSSLTTSKYTMKTFILLFVILVVDQAFGQIVNTKAQSTYQNCNCQCNSDTWTDGNTIKGNCRSRDRNGALFCYVSGRALRSCRDIQQSSFLPNNNGRLKFYSYEACVTPPRNQCSNNQFFGGNQNFGDGDLGFGFGGSNNIYPYRPFGGINSFNQNRPIGNTLGSILGGFRNSGGSSDRGSSRGSVG